MPNLPALDLTTDVERPIVRINHTDYDIRIADDFTAAELMRLQRVLPRVVPLAHKLEASEATEAECEQLSALLVELLQMAVVAPPEVLAKLGDIQKVRLFTVFMELLPAGLRQVRAMVEASQPHGKTSSLRSSASTAGTSRRGRRTSR